MKKFILLFLIYLFQYNQYSIAQIDPCDEKSDYSKWDWQIISQDNWTYCNGIQKVKIACPFTKEINSEITEWLGWVSATKDYTKDKGWELIEARFGPKQRIPHFTLYNKYRAIMRVFFYIGDIPELQQGGIATCYFASTNPKKNPATLSAANPIMLAPDKYINNKLNDIIVWHIPKITLDQWIACDFPIMFDPKIKDNNYAASQMQVTLYGIKESNIKLEGRGGSSSDPSLFKEVWDNDSPHMLVGNKEQVQSGSKINGNSATLVKAVKGAGGMADDILNAYNKIDTAYPQFLQDLKKHLKDGALIKTLKVVSAVAPAVGVVLDIYNLLFGTINETNATGPTLTYQTFKLSGTMTTTSVLANLEVKVPAVQKGPYGQTIPFFDCTPGLITLEKTPNIRVTEPYSRAFTDLRCKFLPPRNIDWCDWRPPEGDTSLGYMDDFVKYKLDEDISLVINQVPDMQLLDVKCAILCKPKKKIVKTKLYNEDSVLGDYYNIIDSNITEAVKWCDPSAEQTFYTENPVYHGLMKGRFIVHKYNPDGNIPEKQEIYFGSPYLNTKCLKGYTFEVPKQTDVFLGVYAVFKVKGFDEPVLFHAKYQFDKKEPEKVEKKLLCSNEEQPVFPFSDYYKYSTSLYTLDQPFTSGTYITEKIVMKPGFSSQPGFIAKADRDRVQDCEDTTPVDPIPYNCGSQ